MLNRARNLKVRHKVITIQTQIKKIHVIQLLTLTVDSNDTKAPIKIKNMYDIQVINVDRKKIINKSSNTFTLFTDFMNRKFIIRQNFFLKTYR
jgi:hypothetical protein